MEYAQRSRCKKFSMAESSSYNGLNGRSRQSPTNKVASDSEQHISENIYDVTGQNETEGVALERRLRLRVDLRLCSIAGILCSLNLLDSGVISSASVTSMLSDLGLTGNRYSISIFIFTIASIAFQLPSTIAVRTFGPRLWFAFITFCFGLITMSVLASSTFHCE